MSRRLVKVTLTLEQAQALHWFARHLGFQDALGSTPPHLGKDLRTEKAYGIVHAAAALEDQIARAGQHGDSWMYTTDAPRRPSPALSGAALTVGDRISPLPPKTIAVSNNDGEPDPVRDRFLGDDP